MEVDHENIFSSLLFIPDDHNLLYATTAGGVFVVNQDRGKIRIFQEMRIHPWQRKDRV
jgi:hypothetical protein